MRSPDPNSVFINVPFDRDYERLFIALIAAITAVGRRPRSILELDGFMHRAGRLGKLVKLIEDSAVSIHDLSRVECTRTAHGMVPRFNMPFELGLACSRKFHGNHQFFIFEKRPRRLVASTSDLTGYEPRIHHGRVKGVLDGVLDMLGATGRRGPALHRVEALDRQLARAVQALRSTWKSASPYNRDAFKTTVVTASKLAAELGLIAPAPVSKRRPHHA